MVSPETRAKIIEMHARGNGRNAIARELELHPDTVSRIAKDAGLRFDRAGQVEQLAAERRNLHELRLTLAYKMADVAANALDQMSQPYTLHNFGGRDNTHAEHTVAEPPADAKADLMRVAAAGFDRLSLIADLENKNSDADNAVELIDRLIGAIDTAYDSEHSVDYEAIAVEDD